MSIEAMRELKALASVQMTPNFTQLMQILDGLNHCHPRDSKVEFLRSWIRDWTQHKVDKLTHPAPSVPATTEPDGWKLVPIVPTEKMLLAYTGGAVTNAGFRWCRHQWSAMLAAAPTAQVPSVPATSEPVLTVEREPDYWSGGHFYEGNRPHINPTKIWSLPIGTKLYTTQQPAQATQAEVADEQILEIAEPFGEFQYGDAQGHKRIDFARAILALRPERVPMTDEQLNDLIPSPYVRGVYMGYSRSDICKLSRAIESHHGITAQAKKGTP